MSEKFKVSREVADVIEKLYIEYGGKTPDRVEIITCDIIKVVEMRKAFKGMRLQDVIKVISEGYEIEKTAKEEFKSNYEEHFKVVDFYKDDDLDEYQSQQQIYSNAYVQGANECARAYGIEIS